MKIWIGALVAGAILAPASLFAWLDHFDLSSSPWDAFLTFAALWAGAAAVAIVAILVLSVRRLGSPAGLDAEQDGYA